MATTHSVASRRTAQAKGLVQEISDSVALISLARLKTADGYPYLHSVAVCALMVALARQLGRSDAHTRSAGLGGLLHGLGKAGHPAGRAQQTQQAQRRRIPGDAQPPGDWL